MMEKVSLEAKWFILHQRVGKMRFTLVGVTNRGSDSKQCVKSTPAGLLMFNKILKTLCHLPGKNDACKKIKESVSFLCK